MSFLDLFRKRRITEDPSAPTNANEQTIYFKNGKMYKVYPTDKESWYDARYLVSDGKMYDLENVKDIIRIPIPEFDPHASMMEGYGVTGSLDYVIRMKAGNARKKGLINESDELYKKAIALMQESGIYYDIKPYLYFAKDLLRDGRFEDSEREEKRAYEIFEKVNKRLSGSYATLSQKLFYDTLNTCKQLHCDYLHIMYHYGTCEKCSIYHGRVYSISGRDKRFPKLPDFIRRTGQIHSGCRHNIGMIDPELYKAIDFRNENIDIIKVSNRPFVVDRTADEISAYEEAQKKIAQRNAPYITQNEREYYRIKYMLPEIAPKSLSGYTRMKNTKSKNFMKLKELAEQNGINIETE